MKCIFHLLYIFFLNDINRQEDNKIQVTQDTRSYVSSFKSYCRITYGKYMHFATLENIYVPMYVSRVLLSNRCKHVQSCFENKNKDPVIATEHFIASVLRQTIIGIEQGTIRVG